MTAPRRPRTAEQLDAMASRIEDCADELGGRSYPGDPAEKRRLAPLDEMAAKIRRIARKTAPARRLSEIG